MSRPTSTHLTRAPQWKPLCTNCAFPTEYVYTTYTSASNIRLAVCSRCNAFVDPLIEAPPLVLALDIVLLKPRVFLHLLFNRGSPPRVAGENVKAEGSSGSGGRGRSPAPAPTPSRTTQVYTTLARLFLAVLAAEVGLRLVSPTAATGASASIPLTILRVAVELIAQLGASTLLGLAILRLRGWYPPIKVATRDGRQEAFMPELIPMVQLYTALIPLLLQLALGIWYTPRGHTGEHVPEQVSPLAFLPPIPILAEALEGVYAALAEAWAADPVWAGTRLLGGMSAGFGLRVLLPTRPVETTAIVLVGWGAAGGVGRLVEWVQS